MNKTLLITSVIAAVAASNANAIELKHYVSGKLGYSHASHNNKWVDLPNSGKFNFSDNVLTGSLAYGVKTNVVRTELELNIKQAAKEKSKDSKISMKNNSVILNSYYDINTNTKLTPYVTAGIGASSLKVDMTDYDNSTNYGKSKHKFTYQGGVGVSYAMNSNLSLDAGYRYTDAGKFKIVESATTRQEFKTQSHGFLVGARYIFNFLN